MAVQKRTDGEPLTAVVLRQALLDHKFSHVGVRGLEERAATGVREAWDE
ncbi:hypothetical protein [Streptomyces tauricus]